MGNNDTRSIRFRQSVNDFPLMVSLGKKTPSFGLKRFKQGLQFIPPDDEGFTLRGDKRQLLYKGRRRSHRFTILGDCSFEYDCILLREPESKVIVLRMEGAENFDFFRQPDFLKEPLLAGSYAVYKKDTAVGEGTGKLCHIHRPEIIDARGRRCWGELSVVGNELRVTIPETWLSEASYPVVVDPTIGTTTVGSQTTTSFKYQSGLTENGLWGALAVNRYLLPEAFNGTATAYLYVYSRTYMGSCKPILYSDAINFSNYYPLTRRCSDEGDFNIAVAAGQQGEWRSTTFSTNTNIQSGDYVWFGISAALFFFRFDSGSKMFWYSYDNNAVNIPNSFPLFPDQRNYDYKMSAYFTFTNPKDYVRTLTQGVNFTDTTKIKSEYKRIAIQTVKGIDVLRISVSFIRRCVMNAVNSMSIERLPVFIRSIYENIEITEKEKNSCEINRKFTDNTAVYCEIKRSRGFFSKIADNLKGTDNVFYPVLFVRMVNEMQGITDIIKKWGDYFRVCYNDAGSITETIRQGEFYRKESDTVKTNGYVLRHLFIFIKIITISLIRDFILRRFLIAREELIIKSVVTRELVIESKIT